MFELGRTIYYKTQAHVSSIICLKIRTVSHSKLKIIKTFDVKFNILVFTRKISFQYLVMDETDVTHSELIDFVLKS